MHTIINRSKALTELLGLFFSNPLRQYYLREIQRITGKPIGTLQRHLSNLQKEGILISKKEFGAKFFNLNADYPYYPELQSIVLRELRREKLETNLKKILKKIKTTYKPDKIILYGSMARKRISPESDIDILIVKNDVPDRYWDRVKEFAPLLRNCEVGVDYIIWTHQELDNEMQGNNFLRDEILGKGEILYERAA